MCPSPAARRRSPRRPDSGQRPAGRPTDGAVAIRRHCGGDQREENRSHAGLPAGARVGRVFAGSQFTATGFGEPFSSGPRCSAWLGPVWPPFDSRPFPLHSNHDVSSWCRQRSRSQFCDPLIDLLRTAARPVDKECHRSVQRFDDEIRGDVCRCTGLDLGVHEPVHSDRVAAIRLHAHQHPFRADQDALAKRPTLQARAAART